MYLGVYLAGWVGLASCRLGGSPTKHRREGFQVARHTGGDEPMHLTENGERRIVNEVDIELGRGCRERRGGRWADTCSGRVVRLSGEEQGDDW
jgi:hypothetical protein